MCMLAILVTLTNLYSSVSVQTDGARILSYRVGGEERLWNEIPAQTSDPVWAHGGIPVCWPWFGRAGEGDAAIHGFAWKTPFRIVSRRMGAERSALELELETEYAILRYSIVLEKTLQLKIETENRSRLPLIFSAAFHPYFLVGERDKVAVKGVKDVPFKFDHTVDDVVLFGGTEPKREYLIEDAARGRTLKVTAENSTGVCLWNPGPEKDCPGTIKGDGWRNFVAVEPMARGEGKLICLKSGEKHFLAMTVGAGE